MPSGLIALLDDVAGIAKLAAASVDDVGAAAGKASTKAAGVVIDDAAVTPRYVTGLSPSRELPIIGKIAVGSVRNKLLLILPVALLLTSFAPWALTPILMCGGAYLCFEGAEKLMEMFGGPAHDGAAPVTGDPAALEAATVSGAVRTDLILSAEIMTIALNDVSDAPLLTQAGVLVVVGLAMTVAVYGVVGLIVKMDDVGLHLHQNASTSGGRSFGAGLVKAMPHVLRVVTVIGTVAMLWVGGHIALVELDALGVPWPYAVQHGIVEPVTHAAGAFLGWLTETATSAVWGLLWGSVALGVVLLVGRLRGKKAAPAH